MKNNSLLIILLIVLNQNGKGQNKVLFPQDFLWLVSSYHPMAKSARLNTNIGQQSILRAKGLFDPKLFGDYNEKNYKDQHYFTISEWGLKIPTWYGVELKSTFDISNGVYLNDENTLPENGLFSTGVSVALGQGLIINKRLAELKKAKIFASSSVLEQQMQLNDLYYSASAQYWDWTASWNGYNTYLEAQRLSQQRFEAIKQSYLQGDKPAIDTLEAFAQLQVRAIEVNQFYLLYQTAGIALSNYLWYEDNIPMEIGDNLTPPMLDEIPASNTIGLDSLENILLKINETHPELLLYKNKRSTLMVDKKLKSDQLKPKLNVHYNFLNQTFMGDVSSTFSYNNYKWGLDFSFPVFLRYQRGDLQITKSKIQQIELGQIQKNREIENKIKAYYLKQLMLSEQMELYKQNTKNYEKLLDGEKQKLFAGESSIFLINTRENKFIDAKIKWIESTIKYKVSQAEFNWALADFKL